MRLRIVLGGTLGVVAMGACSSNSDRPEATVDSTLTPAADTTMMAPMDSTGMGMELDSGTLDTMVQP